MKERPQRSQGKRKWYNDVALGNNVFGLIGIGLALGIALTYLADAYRIDNIEDENSKLQQENQRLIAEQAPPGEPIEIDGNCPQTVETESSPVSSAELNTEIEGEDCIFRWNNPRGSETATIACPENYICTYELTDARILVTLGAGIPNDLRAYAVVLRFAPGYPALDANAGLGWQRDPCAVLRHEQRYYVGLEEDQRAPQGWLVMPFQFSR